MWIALSAVNLALAVMLGAFGAHGLKKIASPEQLTWWQTATDYFFYHALGLLALAILAKILPHFPIKISFILIQVGIFFFLWFALHYGAWHAQNIGCNYPHWWRINDCRLAHAGMECHKIQLKLNPIPHNQYDDQE